MSVTIYQAPPDATAKGKIEDPVEAPQRPDHIPEKFWKDGKVDTDALVKSYTELEKKQSGAKSPTTEKPKAEKPGDEKKGASEQKTEGAEGEKKEGGEENKSDPATSETFKPFFEEFAKDGKLSDATYEKLAKEHNLSRELVDDYIANRQAKVQADATSIEREVSKVFDSVGGQETYTEMAAWARESLPADEIEAFNRTLDAGDLGQIKLAVAGLHQKFTAENGRQGSRFRGAKGGSNLTPFKNTDEVTAAMSDPRYRTDADYRKEVEQRLAASNVF